MTVGCVPTGRIRCSQQQLLSRAASGKAARCALGETHCCADYIWPLPAEITKTSNFTLFGVFFIIIIIIAWLFILLWHCTKSDKVRYKERKAKTVTFDTVMLQRNCSPGVKFVLTSLHFHFPAFVRAHVIPETLGTSDRWTLIKNSYQSLTGAIPDGVATFPILLSYPKDYELR